MSKPRQKSALTPELKLAIDNYINIAIQRELGKKSGTADPIERFFMGSEAEKRPLYEEALRGAQTDQQRVLDQAAAL
jgi:hypothetical protein